MESSVLSFLMLGMSHEHLWFQGSHYRAEPERLMSSLGSVPAFRCAGCKAVTIMAKSAST